MDNVELYHRLLYLVPEAKFVFWPNDGRKSDSLNVIKVINNWCVEWMAYNKDPIPTQNEINNIVDFDLSAIIEKRRKENRDKMCSTNLNLLNSFNDKKEVDATLKFSDFLDHLEEMGKDIEKEGVTE